MKMTSHFIRNWLPDRAIANVLDVVQRIVEHPVRLGAECGPIVRVKGIGGSCGRTGGHDPSYLLAWLPPWAACVGMARVIS